MSKSPPCPACGGADALEIIYGMPGTELAEASARGEVVLGGCALLGDELKWECRACGAQYGDDAARTPPRR